MIILDDYVINKLEEIIILILDDNKTWIWYN